MDCKAYLGLALAFSFSAWAASGCQSKQMSAPNGPSADAQAQAASQHGQKYFASAADVPHEPTLLSATQGVWPDLYLIEPDQQATQAPETAVAAIAVPVQPAPQPDLWRELRGAMHLPLHLDQRRVQQEIAWIQRHPDYVRRLTPRLKTYLPYFYTQTQLRGLPAELALLPIVESALDPFAFSHGGAAGPWQFIRGTARHYGLQMNSWYDGRRDLIASTDAALSYLEDLHRRFGDWYLALAGYNAGQGNVNKALRRKPGASFFDLRLPRETQGYVPKLLAWAAIVADPDEYGIRLPEVLPDQQFTTLDTHSQFQIDKLAAAIGLKPEDIYDWNAALNQWATPPHGPHRIIVPTTLDIDTAQAAIDAIPAKSRVDWTEIRVKSGDSLGLIAQRHGTDVASLRVANNLPNNRIRAGRKLLIPMNAQALHDAPVRRRGSHNASYVVKTGDSLWTIARAHNVGLRSLMRTNHVGPKDTLRVGRKLTIPGQSHDVVRKVYYKVRRGDSLSRIASKFRVTVNQIIDWNQLDRNKYLQPGQNLSVYVNVLKD